MAGIIGIGTQDFSKIRENNYFYIDKTSFIKGTGFDKIVEEYRGVDESHRPYIYSSSDHFTLVLPDLTFMDGVEDSRVPILTFVPVENGTDYDDRVLSFCYYQAHKVSEIAEYLGISDSTYLRKQVLGNLEKQGYLESSKISRATYFKTI